MLNKVKFSFFSAALTLVTLFTSSANAIIQEPGSFVPSRCGNSDGEASFEVSVQSVCVGKIAGSNFSSEKLSSGAVALKLTDGTEQLFRVTQTTSQLMAYANGATEMTFFLENKDGARASLKILKTTDGEIANAIGQFGTAAFFIPQFENVFVIQ